MVDFIAAFLGWLDPAWVVEQFKSGFAVPFVTWTLVAITTGFALGFFVHKFGAGYMPKFLILDGMTRETAQAALDALDAGKMQPVDRYRDALMAAAQAKNSVFAFNDASPDLVGSTGSRYMLSNSWTRYLRSKRRRKKLEKIAGK